MSTLEIGQRKWTNRCATRLRLRFTQCFGRCKLLPRRAVASNLRGWIAACRSHHLTTRWYKAYYLQTIASYSLALTAFHSHHSHLHCAMRLLCSTNDGRLSLTDEMFNDSNMPPYAILSHTWGREEVTFENIVGAKGRTKTGYKKLLFCAQQAATDGLQHCWVDSCCINRSSSAELSEAINSMFRWYQNAKCYYVYLADVSNNGWNKRTGSTESWLPAFKKSRWFTQGWTLQELIAPSSVEFFTKERDCLGDKQSLEEILHEITGVPIKVFVTNR
jgi:hypothetical protein